MFSKKIKFFILIVLLTGIFNLFLSAEETKTIYIAATSDEHGTLFDYDFISKETIPGGLIRVSSWVKEFKNEHPNLIMLSCGDIIQGTTLTTLHNSKYMEEKDPMIIAMNYIGYRASALGNHDIEQGIPVVREIQKQADFPILAANAVHEKKLKKPFFNPYTIFKIDDVKIAVIGMITPGIPLWLNREVYEGIKFLSIPESSRFWVDSVRNKEKPDIIVGLLHSGYGEKEKREQDPSVPLENAAAETALQVPEFDVIITGHIHIPVESAFENGVLITQPGANAKNVTLIEIILEKQDKNWEIKSKTAKLISMETYPADKELFKITEKYFDATKKYSEKPVSKIDRDINTYYAYFRDNAAVDLIQKVQLFYTGADISAAALFSPNLLLKKGEITIADIAGIYKYENFLYVRELTGKQVKDYLEYSATFFNSADNFTEGIFSEKLKGYNFDILEGVDYEIDLSKPEGQRITLLKETCSGKDVNPEKIYKVAMNNYRSNGGGGHLMAAGALDTPIIYRSSKPVRDLIIEYLESGNEFNSQPTNNWKIIQEKEIIQIIDKDIDKIKNMR